jgi:uroporphyrin-III C-methyltransferase
MPGTVALVGAGPGDPELITLRGLRLLEQAEVVVHDRLGTDAVLEFVPDTCERIDAGKAPGRHGMTQDQICDALIHHAHRGKRVVRLKGGDPFVFGRGGEEALALAAAGIPCQIVPGVSSAVAVPAAAGIPVTHRGLARTVTIASGHDDPDSPAARARWQALAPVPGTLVLLMAMSNLDRIAQELIAGGRSADEPAAAIMWGTTAEERRVSVTLATLAATCRAAGIGNPAVVVVGPVVAIGEILGSAFGAAVHNDAGDDGGDDAQVVVEHDEVTRFPRFESAQVRATE